MSNSDKVVDSNILRKWILKVESMLETLKELREHAKKGGEK